jgi:aminopeptidase N
MRYFFVSLLCLAIACRRPVGVNPSVGVSRALAEARFKQIRHPEYRLSFTIPSVQEKPITGEEDLYFDCLDDHEPVQLDFKGEQLRNLSVNGESEVIDFRNEHLVVPVSGGHVHIHIDFVCGDRPLNRDRSYLYTLLVPDRARELFPCFDQPDLKGVFRLLLQVPHGWKVLGNAPLVDSAHGIFRFAPSDTIPTYLFAFVAGMFTDTAVGTMHAYYRETDTSRIRLSLDSLFRIQAHALDFLEEYTGIPFPFKKFDFVAIPAFQFGGMEHPGAIYYKSSALFLDETATRDQFNSRANVLSHETAHMWFGDLVTMRWFNDVWMKEVFANFMADKITGDSRLKFLTDHYPPAYAIDRTQGANPIRQNLDNLQNAGSLYGNIIYHKAPIMMRQLELRMGAIPFRDGLREYLRTYAYGNASWPELIGILQKHTSKDLMKWNNVWVNEPGRPMFRDSCVYTDGFITRLSLVQVGTRVLPQVFDVALVYPDHMDTIRVDMDSASVDIVAASGKAAPSYILYNASGLGYGVFPSDRRNVVFRDPVFRASDYINRYENMLEGRDGTPAALLGRDLSYMEKETEELNLGLLLGQVSAIYWHLLAPSERLSLAPKVESVLWASLSRATTPNERKLLFLCYARMCLSKAAQDKIYLIWSGAKEPPAGVRLAEIDFSVLAEELALRNYPNSGGILKVQAGRIGNPDRRTGFEYLWPSLSPDSAVRDSFFFSLKDPLHRKKESLVVEALGFLSHPIRGRYGEKYIQPSLDWLRDIQQTGDVFFPQNWLQAVLPNAQSPQAAAMVHHFLDTHPDYNSALKGKILQASDYLFRFQAASLSGPTTAATGFPEKQTLSSRKHKDPPSPKP